MHRSVVLCSVAASALLISAVSSACGESLFRLGKGVAYREYTAPLPGKILIVASTPGEIAMVERLSAAGHDVDVVGDPAAVADALTVTRYDVVMSMFANHAVIRGAASDTGADVSYLPVVESGSSSGGVARGLNPHAVSVDDTLKSFLLAIHRTLKARRA